MAKRAAGVTTIRAAAGRPEAPRASPDAWTYCRPDAWTYCRAVVATSQFVCAALAGGLTLAAWVADLAGGPARLASGLALAGACAGGAPIAWGGFTQRRLSGGGPLADIGVRVLDLALWLMGSPRPVGADGATSDRLAHRPGMAAQNRFGDAGPFDSATYDVEDLCAGLVRFANGAALFLETSWLLNQEAREIQRVALYGTGGHACTDPFQVLVDDGAELKNVTPADVPRHGPDFNFLRLERFVECALGRPEPLVRPEEALAVQRGVDALYESAATGRAVALGELGEEVPALRAA